jgi:hypothetical protein
MDMKYLTLFDDTKLGNEGVLRTTLIIYKYFYIITCLASLVII